jgi:hypothetical protein
MADDPSVYGSFMNYFLPQSARVGPTLPVPGLFDMFKGMGFSGASGAQSGTPEEQQRRQQQNLAMAQQGLKMMQPQQTAPTPPPMQAAPGVAPAPLPPATQVTPSTPTDYGVQGGSPYGGLPGANAYAQRRAMPMPMPFPFGGGGGYGR